MFVCGCVCVCVRVCVYICTHTFSYISTREIEGEKVLSMCVCICTCMCYDNVFHLCVCIYVCVCLCLCPCVCACGRGIYVLDREEQTGRYAEGRRGTQINQSKRKRGACEWRMKEEKGNSTKKGDSKKEAKEQRDEKKRTRKERKQVLFIYSFLILFSSFLSLESHILPINTTHIHYSPHTNKQDIQPPHTYHPTIYTSFLFIFFALLLRCPLF